VALKPLQEIGPLPPPPPPPPPLLPGVTETVVLTPFAEPLELLGTTEKVVVAAIVAVATAGLVAEGVAGADQLKLVAGVPLHDAVKVTGPPPATRLFALGVTVQLVGTP